MKSTKVEPDKDPNDPTKGATRSPCSIVFLEHALAYIAVSLQAGATPSWSSPEPHMEVGLRGDF